MESDFVAYNNIQLLVRGRIRFSPDRLLSTRYRPVSEVRLPSSAGMDPDRTDSDEVGYFAMEWNQSPLHTTTSNFSCVVGYAYHLTACYPIDSDQ